jgi:hypothetical protein
MQGNRVTTIVIITLRLWDHVQLCLQGVLEIELCMSCPYIVRNGYSRAENKITKGGIDQCGRLLLQALKIIKLMPI